MSVTRRLVRHRAFRPALAALGVALAVLVFAVLLPRIASYETVWSVVRTRSWVWVAALAAAAVADIASGGPLWMVVIPGLGLRRALRMTLISTALSAVAPSGAPVGMAASYAVLRSFGVAARRVASAIALVGVWSQMAALAFPGIAAVLLALGGNLSPAVRGIAALGAGVLLALAALLLLLLSPRAARVTRAVERLAPRRARRSADRLTGAIAGVRAESRQILDRRWAPLTIATLANQLTGFLILELALLAVGIPQRQVTVIDAFAAWSVARLLMSVPLTPAGLGIVELGLTGLLVGFGGPRPEVVAAVLAFRIFTLFPMLLGGIAAGALFGIGARRETHAVPRRWRRAVRR